ncbi:hypothetical protein BITS_1840 [Bifidobacterium tsurumiense]|uniref:Uncharacterized protein n=1 Tax=Bifidobacterium tsurumiense TaxID=356829 RepID=A0A087EE23_9BIFI|nr:hypothetical protein BITS_1840 [Bifidobacterium tsurumiense]
MSMHGRFAENAKIGVGLAQCLGDVFENRFAIAFHHNGVACGNRSIRNRQRGMTLSDRKSEDRACVERKFAETLRHHGHHAGVMRAGGNLIEQHCAIGEYE